MDKRLQARVMRHALAEYPREACGLVVRVNGRRRYVRCRNLARDPSEHFRIDPEDYAAAEDLGEVVAVVHSHPDAPARPSPADRLGCESSGLPWVILSVRAEDGPPAAVEWAELQPSGWRAPLIGRGFVHGVFDCYALVRDYYRRELGIELPDYEREDEWWNKGQDLYAELYAAAGFVPVATPREGDLIVMQHLAPVMNHGGVYLESGRLASEPDHYPAPGSILHHLYGQDSRRDPYGGYWADCTRLILRHRDRL